MASAPNANNMMAGIVTSGLADSGYGITLAGFHCPVQEFLARLSELQAQLPATLDFAHWEENGHVTFIACAGGFRVPQKRAIATLRREPHKLFVDLPMFLAQTRAQHIDRLSLTGSLGSIALTLLYRPVKESNE